MFVLKVCSHSPSGICVDPFPGHLVGRVVDQDVELAQLRDRSLDQRPAVRFLGDVAGSQHGLPPRLAHDPGRLLGIGILVQIGDEDVGALAGEGQRHRAADAAVTTGDERDSCLASGRAPDMTPRRSPAGRHLRLEPGILQAVLREWRLGPGFAGVLGRRGRGHVRAPDWHVVWTKIEGAGIFRTHGRRIRTAYAMAVARRMATMRGVWVRETRDTGRKLVRAA